MGCWEILNTFCVFLSKQIKCWTFNWKGVLFGLFATILLCWIQIYVFDKGVEREKSFVSLTENDLISLFPSGLDDKLIYTPNTTFNDKLVENLRQKLGIFEQRVHSFASRDELDLYFEMHRTNRDFAIIFENSEIGGGEIPMKLNYTIRTRNNNFRTSDVYVNDVFDVAMKETDEYINSGFLALQQSLDRSFIEMIPGVANSSSFKFEYQKFPFNARNALFLGFVPIGFTLLWAFSIVLIIMVLIPLVQEKESGIKEYLRIASSHSYLNNVALFLLTFIVSAILFTIVYCTARFNGFLEHVDVISLTVLMICYLLSAISFTFMVSVMFTSVFYAKVGSMMVFSLSFLVLFVNRQKSIWLIPFFNNAMLIDSFSLLDSYGKRGLVFKLCNNSNDHFEDYYSFCETCAILLFDSILYLTIYQYFVKIFPGSYGTPKPYYFPLMLSLFCRNRVDTKSIMDNDPTSVEEGCGLSPNAAVRIRGLTKIFHPFGGAKRVAVNQLSMDIPRNQITVLLGHNGAGKTTTMSMISGIISKTSGSISVNGQDNINNYRHMIGYCPQHNSFMPYFTCKDHLMFFAALRGLNKKDAEDQAKHLLNKLHLSDKANEYANNLSGGMKRRLCLGNAIIGNTQIAILDEPSSGLDPQSRRELWTILLDLRKDHTILLTTHYMEEAETLADQIFIIAHGEHLCNGTSIQLKKKYSVGYVLKLLTNEHFNESKTMDLIQSSIPNAKVKAFIAPTFSVSLPYNDFNKYGMMLEDVEKNLVELGVSSISITNSSLEEVFLTSDPRKMPLQCNDSIDEVDSTAYFPLDGDNDPKIKYRIRRQQCLAIFYKKKIYMREQWLYWSLLFLTPFIALFICFSTIHSSITYKAPSESIQLNLAHINYPDVLFLVNSKDLSSYQQILEDIIEGQNSTIRLLKPSNKSVKNELLSIERDNITYYNERLASGIVIQRDEEPNHLLLNIMYSGNSIHSSPVAVNLISNMILKSTTNGHYEIHLNNDPLMRDKLSVNKSDLDIFALLIPFAMFLYILFYVFLPFNEDRTEFRKLQNISPFLFWFTNFAIDLSIHLILCFVVYFTCKGLDRHNIFDNKDYFTLTTLLFFYGFAYIPLMYVFGQSFKSMSSLFSFLSYFFLIFCIASSFLSSSEENMTKYDTYITLLLLFPDYTLRHAMNAMFIIYTKAQIAKQSSHFEHFHSKAEFLSDTSSYVDAGTPLDLKKIYIYFTVVWACGMLMLLFVCENIYSKEKILNLLSYVRCRKGGTAACECTDDDVREERMLTDQVVKENQIEDYPIVVSNLRKCYGNVTAVNGINFTVKKGECFGLLGMNGAGKTTTFKMMTRDITITKGEIYFNGIGCHKCGNQTRNLFGYCPQVDALNNFMTAYESLKFMALLRGLTCEDADKEVKRIIEKTDLSKYTNIRVNEYSGGTKRKLNTALAMITHPSLVFLDEPTTGVDPTSRRFMWSCIQDFQKHNKNIVLTSHSMDECEFLCNRLAIMANGQLECIGPVQHLKNRYGRGFLLIVMVNPENEPLDISRVKAYLTNLFDCILREEYASSTPLTVLSVSQGLKNKIPKMCFSFFVLVPLLLCHRKRRLAEGKLSYIVNNSHYKWSDVFKKIQKFLATFTNVVYDISVLETSLEDIFLQIARKSSSHADTEITVSAI